MGPSLESGFFHSLSTPLRFFQVLHVSAVPSILLLSSIQLYGCTTIAYHTYHSPSKGLLGCSSLGGITNNVINICGQDFG